VVVAGEVLTHQYLKSGGSDFPLVVEVEAQKHLSMNRLCSLVERLVAVEVAV
jgi:hypothetical protein